MPRLIDVATIDGSQLDISAGQTRLTIWDKGPDGVRQARVLEGDEAIEAAVEIKDWLAGQSDGESGTGSRRNPSRKARKGA